MVTMKPALLKTSLPQPKRWDELPKGQVQYTTVEDCLNTMSRRFFGYHLVKLGYLSSFIRLQACPIHHHINLTLTLESSDDVRSSRVLANTNELPFSQNSVDAFVLVHELDFAIDPHQILREVDRCIIHNGYVVIVGYNPFSLTSLLRWLPAKRKQTLKHARYFSVFRVKDWLNLLGFEILEVHRQAYAGNLYRGNLNWLKWLESSFRKYLPWFSSRYVILAKKRVIPLSLIKPKWKPTPKFSAVSASMRNV